jgi:hypothetical protein
MGAPWVLFGSKAGSVEGGKWHGQEQKTARKYLKKATFFHSSRTYSSRERDF